MGTTESRPTGAEPRLTTIYWRHIPAQVKARAGRRRAGAPLPDRFQVAIDQAASRAGKTGTEEYLAEWREESRACEEDLEEVVGSEVSRLDEEFTEEVLQEYVRNKGWAPG